MTTQPTPKRGKDSTRTPRQKRYLDRLEADTGKRVVIDLSREGREQLEQMIAAEYGTNQADVMRRALSEAHERLMKKRS